MTPSDRKTLLEPARVEIEKGCLDKVVGGGFAKFAIGKLEQIGKQEPENIAVINYFIKYINYYDRYEPEKRKQLLEKLVAFLEGEEVAKKTSILAKPNPNRQKFELTTPIKMVPGVGPSRAEKFEKFGLSTVFDLLRHFPNRYIDRTKVVKISKIKVGADVSFFGKVLDVRLPRPGKRYLQALFGDDSGKIMATWFNAPYIAKKLAVGKTFLISGRVGDFGGPHMTNPDLDDKPGSQRIIPVYPATASIQQWLIQQTIKFVLERMPELDPGWIPDEIVKRLELPSLTDSYFTIHHPPSEESVEISRKRVVMESLLLLEAGLLRQRALFKKQTARKIPNATESSREFFEDLPFKPTNAQDRSRAEIAKDLESSRPMNRLLHGDVGSGKTVVGFSAVKAIMDAGFQAAWIAPTEVLATQTFKNAKKFFGDKVLYLSGSTKKAERAEIFKLLSTGEPFCVIGTHAVLEDWIEFPKLALCVVDEQHRFGVLQRARLARKGSSPHILVMSATPIPRTLAMTLYGDLDVSAIDEMPEGRIPIITKVCINSESSAYKRALSEISKGNKTYVVCPLVEESEKLEAKSAVEHFEELKATRFREVPCGLLHGRMKPAEKDEVMRAFADGMIKVLISTTVIEVGIDVPDATVMIVENAERFGLAQLHQLRGRVGRGKDQSYCFLLTDRPSQNLMILERTNNGLEVAEEDLKLRGPGDIGGTQQAGAPTLEVAPLLTPTNLPLLTLARTEAEAILATDPELTAPGHERLKEGIEKYMTKHTGFAWVS